MHALFYWFLWTWLLATFPTNTGSSALKVHNGHKLLNSLSFGELDQLNFDGLTYPLLTHFSAINTIRCLCGDSAAVAN